MGFKVDGAVVGFGVGFETGFAVGGDVDLLTGIPVGGRTGLDVVNATPFCDESNIVNCNTIVSTGSALLL